LSFFYNHTGNPVNIFKLLQIEGSNAKTALAGNTIGYGIRDLPAGQKRACMLLFVHVDFINYKRLTVIPKALTINPFLQ